MIETPRPRHQQLKEIADKFAQDFAREIARAELFPSCMTCAHFEDQPAVNGSDYQSFYCRRYQRFPPVDIIINSCGVGYEDNDEIPY